MINTSELSKYLTDAKILSKGRVMIKCVFHTENHPSLMITTKSYFCFGCKKTGSSFFLLNKVLLLDKKICQAILGPQILYDQYKIFHKFNQSQTDNNKHNILKDSFEIFNNNLVLLLKSGDTKNIYYKTIFNFIVNTRKFSINTIKKCNNLGFVDRDNISQLPEYTRKFWKKYTYYNKLKWKKCLVFLTHSIMFDEVINIGFRSIMDKSFWFLSDKHKGFLILKHNRKGDTVILTEGIFDGIRLLEHFNFDNIYCLNGSTISKEDLKKLTLRFKQIILCLDNDDIGITNTHKILMELLMNYTVDVKIVNLQYKDADENFINTINMEYYFTHYDFIIHFLNNTTATLKTIAIYFIFYHKLFKQYQIQDFLIILKKKYNTSSDQEFLLKYKLFFSCLEQEKKQNLSNHPNLKERFVIIYNFFTNNKIVYLTKNCKNQLEILSKYYKLSSCFNNIKISDNLFNETFSYIEKLINNIFIEWKILHHT